MNKLYNVIEGERFKLSKCAINKRGSRAKVSTKNSICSNIYINSPLLTGEIDAQVPKI
jgi:hypothetical protein